MLTDVRTVVNALVGVLFLTMIVLDLTLLNLFLFGALFYLMWNFK